MNEALWFRALNAVDARGLLPLKRSSLTPRELAAQAAGRGEDRLRLLVEGWYYPASYGHVRGGLTDEEAGSIVAALEAESEVIKTERPRAEVASARFEPQPAPRNISCDLCGRPL